MMRRLRKAVAIAGAVIATGKALASAYAAASGAARSAADAMMSSLRNAVDAVRDGVELAGQTGEELGYAGKGVAQIVSNEASGKARALYARARNLFSDSDSPAASAARKCPRADLRTEGVNVFSETYREGIVGSSFNGAGDPELAKAMHALAGKNLLDDPDPHLRVIAEKRGRSFEDMKADYDKYVDARKVAEVNRKQKGLDPIPPLNANDADFMGSPWQLRYGAIVGDHMDMDPVFGSMLNPTGGLVGEGEKGWRPDGALMPESVAYHGAYHDAMGYLYNYHGDGPGYNYLHASGGFDTGNPLAGQTTGVPYWNAKLNAR